MVLFCAVFRGMKGVKSKLAIFVAALDLGNAWSDCVKHDGTGPFYVWLGQYRKYVYLQ
jgi:hypothetical protein